MTIALSVSSPGTIDTYTLLKAYLAATLDRSDLTDRIPNFIRLAEARLARIITHPEGETTANLTTIAGQETLALPTGFRQMVEAHVVADPIVTLSLSSPSSIREQWNSGSGGPQTFAIVAGNMVFGPVPDAVYTIGITYLASLTPLSPDGETNWLLTTHPDAYFYASLIQAEAYLANDDRIPLWKAGLDETIAEINAQGNRFRSSAAPLRLRSPVCV